MCTNPKYEKPPLLHCTIMSIIGKTLLKVAKRFVDECMLMSSLLLEVEKLWGNTDRYSSRGVNGGRPLPIGRTFNC